MNRPVAAIPTRARLILESQALLSCVIRMKDWKFIIFQLKKLCLLVEENNNIVNLENMPSMQIILIFLFYFF